MKTPSVDYGKYSALPSSEGEIIIFDNFLKQIIFRYSAQVPDSDIMIREYELLVSVT